LEKEKKKIDDLKHNVGYQEAQVQTVRTNLAAAENTPDTTERDLEVILEKIEAHVSERVQLARKAEVHFLSMC
jgi:hypothetical protein